MSQKQLQKRFEGFLQTPCLWQHDAVASLQQFTIETKQTSFTEKIDEHLRLGKYIERFVSFQIRQEKDYTIVRENIQIQRDKLTLGELDCLLLKDKNPIHLEIVYKFYLFDASVGKDEIDHLIGPNRKDSLVDKLTKLSQKQLPLLYAKETEKYLKEMDFTIKNATQQVYFKAQLFVPFAGKNIKLTKLNTACIAGFYIHKNQLINFRTCTFFIPIKKDWLLKPHKRVSWLHFEKFSEKATEYLAQQYAPLCWMKFNNGELQKFFLVWW